MTDPIRIVEKAWTFLFTLCFIHLIEGNRKAPAGGDWRFIMCCSKLQYLDSHPTTFGPVLSLIIAFNFVPCLGLCHKKLNRSPGNAGIT